MTLQNYTTEELKAELKRRYDLAEAEEAKKKEDVLKFTEFIEKQAKAYGFNLPNRDYDVFGFAKDLLAWLEKQNEQKSTDKIEPKFKVGDWIIFNKGKGIYKVEKIENYEYTLRHILGGSMPLSFSGEGLIRKWTIEDAKDGDVLACNEEVLLFKSYLAQEHISLYCWYNGQTNNFHSEEVIDILLTTRNKIHPATNEQRDLLFTKMKEAGYRWDFNKKELIKIEDESENYKQQIMSEINESVQKYIDWLRSLKKRIPE